MGSEQSCRLRGTYGLLGTEDATAGSGSNLHIAVIARPPGSPQGAAPAVAHVGAGVLVSAVG